MLASFEAEKEGDVAKNAELLHEDFKVVDMVIAQDGSIFPTLEASKLKEQIDTAFKIEGREFTFKTVVADESTQTVVVEFIESYPDPETSQLYRTPQVAICQIKDGKIYRTRHYMDPRLSYENLSQSQIEKALE